MGKLEASDMLIDAGAKVNLSNHDGSVPLHSACERGYVDIVLLLLERGADVNRSNVFGWVPLHFAAKNGHHEVKAISFCLKRKFLEISVD